MEETRQSSSLPDRLPGLIILDILILLGLIGLLTRWPAPADVISAGGAGISFNSLTGFPQNFENRFNTNFFMRDQLIHLDYQIRYFLLHETVYPQVVLGKQGWMYYTNEGNLEYYQRVRPLTPQKTNQIGLNLQNIEQSLDAQDIKFLFVIAPNKETIYPEFLPEGIRTTGNPTWADQITKELANSPVQVLDLRGPLLQAKQKEQVYFRTDTHWNPVGAHLAYTNILNSLQPSFPILNPHPISDFDQVEQISSGDLAELIHLEG